MPSFQPFHALRYADDAAPNGLSDFIAPPYDVIDPESRTMLEKRSARNAVRLDYPQSHDGQDAYQGARACLDAWRSDGTLTTDPSPTFTIYRMTATDETGHSHVTTGVLGSLELEEPGTGDILPHEETTSKDKADRLNLIRAAEINTSPIWVLSMASGVADSYTPDGKPDQSAVDDDGVAHEVWVVSDPVRCRAISDAVNRAPVVVADGHHRFETALAYQAESTGPAAPVGRSALLAYVVELAEHELEVRPIHRIVEVPRSLDVRLALAPWFEEVGPLAFDENDDVAVVAALVEAGAIGLVLATGAVILRPRDDAFDASVGLDSERARAVVSAINATSVRFHHSVATVTASTRQRNDADTATQQFGMLLRPATVAQIRLVAEQRTRMPAKTTFFWPKPRSGMLYRPLR